MHVPVADHTRRSVRRVADLVARADALLVTAGAGMGVDSGLPDFRSPQGLWRAYPALAPLGLSFEELAQPRWFAERPGMAWAWYGHRQQLYRESLPHAGYWWLHHWAGAMPAGSFIVTSNVDGQFPAVGFDAEQIVEQHGSVHRYQCTLPCSDRTWVGDDTKLDIDLARLQARGELPRCPDCGALARPNVMMFSDTRWVDAVRREQQTRFDRWLARVRGRRLVVVECGAGTAIPTIRRIGERMTERTNTTLVRINPAAIVDDDSTVVLKLPALQALTLVADALPQRFLDRCGGWDASGSPSTSSTQDSLAADNRLAAGGQSPPDSQPTTDSPPAADTLPVANDWPARPIRLAIGRVTHVDLGRGLVGELNGEGITARDELTCLKRYMEAQRAWAPLPVLDGRTASGYTMTARILRSPEVAAGGTPGSAMVWVQGPDREAVMTLGLARRASDGPFVWQLLHETANRRTAPLDYPPVPWIARRPDSDLAQHSMVLPALECFERTFAKAWFRAMAFLDAQRERQAE
jgi:NAD-dependent SIR2 family protein deacetylase